jgi:hypothetical protein
LKEEALIKEFVRAVQERRKEKGFEIKDLTNVFVFGDKELIEIILKNKEVIKKETNSNEIIEKEVKEKELEFDGKRIYFECEKAQ